MRVCQFRHYGTLESVTANMLNTSTVLISVTNVCFNVNSDRFF
jgi:hypothetical protein